MKKNYTFILSLLFCISINSQQISKSEWKNDLDDLKNHLLQKEYLFYRFSKKDFNVEIEQLKKNVSNLKKDEIYWQIVKILSHFKTLDLNLENANNLQFPLELKVFKGKYYLTKINKENNYVLKHQVININGFTISEIINKLKAVFYLPHKNIVEKSIVKWLPNKALLLHLNIAKKDTLKLMLKSKNNSVETINLPFIQNVDTELLATVKPKKELFHQRKNNVWYWKYGINFGKQVFFKYRVCSSKEHINKMLDSLNISAKDYAKAYKLKLQEVYDAQKLNSLLEKVVEKFEKRRYKKLIIDLRNNTKGAFLSTKKLIQRVKKIKRINKKGKLFILINKNTNAAAIKTALEFQNTTKALIVGENVFGTQEDSDKTNSFKLANSKLRVNYPALLKEEINLKPNILVEPTFSQYQKGIDGLLQKVLDY